MLKQIFVIFCLFSINNYGTEALFEDWMLPNFSSWLSGEFFRGMQQLKDSMSQMKSDFVRMNQQMEELRNRKFSNNELASIFNYNDSNAHLNLGGCNCQNFTCSCCAHVEVAQVNLNDTICLDLVYVPKEAGIEFDLQLDGKLIYNASISASNPPTVLCVDVPYLTEAASLCLKFYNLDISNGQFSGCVDVVAKLAHIEVTRVKIGCFTVSDGLRFFQQGVVSVFNPQAQYVNEFNQRLGDKYPKSVLFVSSNSQRTGPIVINANIQSSSGSSIFSSSSSSSFSSSSSSSSSSIRRRKRD